MVEILLPFRQLHLFWEELRHVAMVLINVAHDARRNTHQLTFSQQEDGFQFGMEALVSMANHVLVFKVTATAQATDDDIGTHFLAEVGGKALVTLHLHLGVVLEHGLAPLDAVLKLKGGALLHVDADTDIDFVEHGQGSQNNATVPQGDGVEGTGENGYSFHSVVFTF